MMADAYKPLDVTTGGEAYAQVRKASNYTALVNAEFDADWLPRGDFRPAPESQSTPATRFVFEVDTSQRATPIGATSARPVERAGEVFAVAHPSRGVEREAAVRLELLVRKSAHGVSPEDDARLKVATERLRRLLPRVTADDFEALADAAEKVAKLGEDAVALRRELALDE